VDVVNAHGSRQRKTDHKATATLEGGRLHNRLCDCVERCVHLHRMGYVEATVAPPTTSPPSLAERCKGYFSCFVTR
jgi:hypothetical protein